MIYNRGAIAYSIRIIYRLDIDMARDKQLVVRVTEETRAAFQDFCEREGQRASTLLADIIERLCQGSLSLDGVLGRSPSPDLVMEKVENVIEQRLEGALSEWLMSSQLAERIESLVAPPLAALAADTQATISEAMAAFQVQGSARQDSLVLAADLEGDAPRVPAKSAPKQDWRIDLSDYDPNVGFTAAQLAAAIGLKSSSPIFGAIDKGRFDSWSQKKDPEGRTWSFRGKKTERRFFRGGEMD